MRTQKLLKQIKDRKKQRYMSSYHCRIRLVCGGEKELEELPAIRWGRRHAWRSCISYRCVRRWLRTIPQTILEVYGDFAYLRGYSLLLQAQGWKPEVQL